MRALTTAASMVRHSSGALAEAFLLAILIAALLLVLAPVSQQADFLAGTQPVAAGRGGGHGGGGGGGSGGGECRGKKCTTPTAQVTVTPNPVPSYSEFSITGCGYTPGVGLQFNLYSASGTAIWGGTADTSGCIASVSGWANAPGSARLDVLEGSVTLVATTTFTIE